MSAREYLNETGLASLWAKIVNKINAVGDTCVKKIGDTITGTLFLTTSSSIQVKTNIDKEVIPTEDIAKVLYNFRDKNDNNIGVLQARQYKDVGNIATIIGANREVKGTTYFNQLALSLTPTGEKVVHVSDKPAWRSALGLATVASSGNYNDLTNKPTIPDISTKVSKSGDTMTGILSMKATNVDASKANNNVSSTQYPTTYNILDNAGRIISRKEGIVQSDGQIGSYWYTRNYNTSGGMVAQKGIRMMMNKSGALTWSVDDAASFRSAIGLYYEEQNGVSGCVSSNNTTVDYIKCIRIGKIVTVTFSFVNSTAKTGELAWVALKPNFRPSGRIYFPCNIVGNSTAYTNESCHRMYIYLDGTMKMWIDNTNATVSACMGSVSYCIN